MVNKYTDIELIAPEAREYILWGRRQRKKHKGYKDSKGYKKDSFAVNYQKEMRNWENIIRKLLNVLTCAHNNRILKYRDRDVGVCYREIDFIAKPDEKTLTFVEIKLKDNYNPEISYSKSGLKQINDSILIAKEKYDNLNGLSICIDMSYLYGIESQYDNTVFDDYFDIPTYLMTSSENNTIWLNSKEISRIAIEKDLLKKSQIDDIKRLFNEKNDPLSLLNGNKCDDLHNNQFEILKTLKLNK